MYGQVIFCLFLVGFSMMAGSWHTLARPEELRSARVARDDERSQEIEPGPWEGCPGYPDRPVPRSPGGRMARLVGCLPDPVHRAVFSTFPLCRLPRPAVQADVRVAGWNRYRGRPAAWSWSWGRRTGASRWTPCCGGGCTCPAR